MLRTAIVGLLLAVLLAGCDVAAGASSPGTRDAGTTVHSTAPGPRVTSSRTGAARPSPATDPAPSSPAAEPLAVPRRPEPDGAAPAAAGTVRLMAVGDVMLARTIGQRILRNGPDFVFAGVQDILDRADLLVINLECTISTRGHPADKHWTFRAPPVAADALVKGGVDVAGQANNHGMDWGPDALADTRQLLTDRGIGDVGAGPDRATAHAPVVIEKNGLRIAFLAYVAAFSEVSGFTTSSWEAGKHTPGLAIGHAKDVRRDVSAAAAQADLVIVSIHAGYEGTYTPNRVQKRLAHAALGAGATLVLGAHPHVLQGYELNDGKMVAYSLGDFVFDSMPPPQRESAILDVTLTAEGVTHVHWVPILLAHGLPVPATGATAKRIMRHLKPL